jgi:hypothetical protein
MELRIHGPFGCSDAAVNHDDGVYYRKPGRMERESCVVRAGHGMRTSSTPRRAWVMVLAAVILGVSSSHATNVDELLEFGVEMALKSNWREARYRWERAEAESPGDARVLNNLAVGAEALGNPGEARALYDRALRVRDVDARIRENARRSERFWSQARGAGPGEGPTRPPSPAPESRRSKRRAVVEVEVPLPVPARLDLGKAESLLVASFLVNDTDLIDANREIVRYLRGEFRKRTGLEVLEVTPAPAIPEQTVEDLVANAAFWRHLGQEFRADILVSGVMGYGRRDVSGFKDVDVVDDRTGQKVRTTRFVEQEQFDFELEVFFFDGKSGALLHRDRFTRSSVYRGLSNDPITAFYDLSGTIAGDVLAVVSQSTRPDPRVLFKR